jgi:hypothetical protein
MYVCYNICKLNKKEWHPATRPVSLLLSELASNHVNVDIVVLQETWHIPNTEIVKIPVYAFTHQHRTANKGGGVGFYMRNAISSK